MSGFLRFFFFALYPRTRGKKTAIYWKNGEFHSDPVCTDPVENFPTVAPRKVSTLFDSNTSNSSTRQTRPSGPKDPCMQLVEGCDMPDQLHPRDPPVLKTKKLQFTGKMGNFTPTPTAPTPLRTSRTKMARFFQSPDHQYGAEFY